MSDAYKSSSVDLARKRRLGALVEWLARNRYDEAAGSLRKELEETLIVLKLNLPPLLRRSLATTNAIENLMGSIRRLARNARQWKGADMIRGWTVLGIVSAA